MCGCTIRMADAIRAHVIVVHQLIPMTHSTVMATHVNLKPTKLLQCVAQYLLSHTFKPIEKLQYFAKSSITTNSTNKCGIEIPATI